MYHLKATTMQSYLEHEGEWDPLVECRVGCVGCGEVKGVPPGEDGVDDAAHVALELAADVERRVDPAVVVHHLRAHAGGSLQNKGKIQRG